MFNQKESNQIQVGYIQVNPRLPGPLLADRVPWVPENIQIIWTTSDLARPPFSIRSRSARRQVDNRVGVLVERAACKGFGH